MTREVVVARRWRRGRSVPAGARMPVCSWCDKPLALPWKAITAASVKAGTVCLLCTVCQPPLPGLEGRP